MVNFEKFAYVFISVLMPELLTTDEAATYLRLSERKLYVESNGRVA